MAGEDLLAVIKFKNLLLERLKGDSTYDDMEKDSGVSKAVIVELLNLKISPRNKWGAYKPAAKKLAAHYGYTPEEMFPDSLYALNLPKKLHREFNSVQLVPLLEAKSIPLLPDSEKKLDMEKLREGIFAALDTLKPREQAVIAMRFGLFENEDPMTLEAIGKEIGVPSKEGVRQIEANALKKLRHPNRCRPLRKFLE